MNVLCLDGMSTAQALRVIGRRLDRMCALELGYVERELIDAGVGRHQIDVMVECRRLDFVEWAAAELIELRGWLVGCNRRLH